jgi:hypothetical protein
MASFGEITNHLLEKGIVKNKGEASHAVGELVDMGAVDRVKPKGLRIRDEWVELPSGVIARQTVEFKSRKQKIPKAPRQKAIREAYKKKAASQTPISRTRAISGSRELKGFVEETSNFIAKKRITQESFDRMFNLYKGRFSDGKYYAPEVIANFLIESRSEQTRVNLPYTTVFDFATWIQGQKWREAEKQGQQ